MQEVGDNVKVLQDRNSELMAEIMKIQNQHATSIAETSKIIQEVLQDNNKLVLEIRKLGDHQHKLYNEIQKKSRENLACNSTLVHFYLMFYYLYLFVFIFLIYFL